MKTTAIVVLGMFSVAPPVIAQERPPDVLFILGQSQTGAGVYGGTGEIEWLKAPSPRTTVTVGGAATSFSDLWWTYGTLGGSLQRRGVTYSTRWSGGAGQWNQTAFPYQRYVGQVTVPVTDILYVESEAQHVEMAGITANVFRLGATYSAPAGVQVGLSYHAAPWDPTHDRAVSVRGLFQIRRVTMTGGVVATARKATAINVTALDVTTRIAREYFAGCVVPARASSVIVSAQVAPQPHGQIVRLLVAVKHPFGRSTQGPESRR